MGSGCFCLPNSAAFGFRPVYREGHLRRRACIRLEVVDQSARNAAISACVGFGHRAVCFRRETHPLHEEEHSLGIYLNNLNIKT